MTERPLGGQGQARNQSWKLKGVCGILAQDDDYYLDLWFAPEDTVEAEHAASICSTCPVRSQCEDFGMEEPYGIWGGLPLSERLDRSGDL